MVDTSENDLELNDVFGQSIPIDILEEKNGHIGYVKGGTDDAGDYYRTVKPYDGTLRVIVQGRNKWGANGYLYMYGYDRRKAGGQLFSKYVANSSNKKPIPPFTIRSMFMGVPPIPSISAWLLRAHLATT